MNTPPLLMAATLLFWGWQTGHLVMGFLAGAALESSRVIKMRWSLSQADFNRLWNVCVVLFLGVGVFLLLNEGTISFNDFFVNAGRRPEAIRQAGKSALVWFQWLPMIFLPFMVMQAFNDQDKVGMATFSWWLRRQEKRNPHSDLPRDGVNVAFPYLALCLLAASATTERNEFFYVGIAFLVGWSLWPLRTKRHSIVAWCLLFSMVAIGGYGGHNGLFRLQKKLEEMNVTWFSRLVNSGTDWKETRTAMGSIGRLKMSDRIVLRLRTERGGPPELLREASYNSYRKRMWMSPQHGFGPVSSEADNETWKLLPEKQSRRAVTIAGYLRGGSGIIAVPTGLSEITELPAVGMETNLFGVTRVLGAPGLVIYNARYDSGATFDSAPAAEDSRSYEESEPAVATIARELQLRQGMPPREAMKRVAALFQEKFQYATYLSSEHVARSNETALARFLLHTRSGHCEYFATATALLLREAGLPTRYAVGYSVQEGSGKKYVVRQRHAHSWTLVYFENAWHDFDTTPSSWNAIESQHSSWLRPLKDFFSDLWFQFSKFRWSKTEWRKYFMWAPVPLLIIVLWRFFRGRQWKKLRAKRDERRKELLRQGIDSDFYRIEKYFAARGLERGPSENWSEWLRRIEQHESDAGQLSRVLALHQRHRFDPRGLNADERAELRSQVHAWLSSNSAGAARTVRG